MLLSYKNKTIQMSVVEANGAMALQPVEAPGPVCQQTAKIKEKNIFTTNQVGVASVHVWSHPSPQTLPKRSDVQQLQLMNLVIPSYVMKRELGSGYVIEFRLSDQNSPYQTTLAGFLMVSSQHSLTTQAIYLLLDLNFYASQRSVHLVPFLCLKK